jgi:A/G-specific adenine glycosylase
MLELNRWFKKNRRSFPWRDARTPYKVWISEVMLQQTRSSVVVPYFLRWLEKFPNVVALAEAPLEEVIKVWEGLGYYSRARNLHKGAKQVVSDFGGEIPDSREALMSICGLGPYTVGAILSFGFHKRAAAVDGNTIRVISRYLAIEENSSSSRVRRAIEEKTEALLDKDEPWVTSEALIELGATLCVAKPRCDDCPLKEGCLGLKKGIAELLPLKNVEKKTTLLNRVVAVIEARGQFLVKKGDAGKVMADLYEFPYFEGRALHPAQIGKVLGLGLEYERPLEEVVHTFTRFKARLFPVLLKASSPVLVPGYAWVFKKQLADLPFSSGHRKIANQL